MAVSFIGCWSLRASSELGHILKFLWRFLPSCWFACVAFWYSPVSLSLLSSASPPSAGVDDHDISSSSFSSYYL
jgi:hypothetical protein